MTSTTFVANTGSIDADWLNDVDTVTYNVSNKSAAITVTPVSGTKIFVESSDGGWFIAKTGESAGTYSDNGGSFCGTIFIPTGGDGSKAWIRDFFGAVNVKWFGAIGDGATDDIVSLQATVDYVESTGGGTVFFPESTYLVTDTLTIDDIAVVLLGESAIVEQMFTTSVAPAGSVIKLGDAAFNSASKAIVEFTYQGSNSEARMGCGMRNMVVFGNRSTDTASPNGGTYNNNNTYGIGIHIVGLRYITLENVFSLWCAEDGFKAITGGSQSTSSNNMMFSRCVAVSNGDDGYDIAGGDSHLFACHAGFNGGDGYALSVGKSIVGCVGWDNFGNGLRISSSGITVNGGSFYDNEAAGVLISGTLERVVLAGIETDDNGKDTGLTDPERSGIYISGASSVAISGVATGNKDGVTQQYGIRITNTAADVKYSGITDGGIANTISMISDLSAFNELTVSSGVVTATDTTHKVDTEADAATDDLDTINGGYEGMFLTIRSANSGRDTTLKDGTGNLILAGDFTLLTTGSIIFLQKIGSSWYEISRSAN